MSEKTNVTFLNTLGSLWFAAVLAMLLLVSMACATVYESEHGTDAALALFYKSAWFKVLLYLLGFNALAGLAARLPFTRRQIGFILTHLSILVILGGALLSQVAGVDGRLQVTQGESVDRFGLSGRPVLTLSNQQDGKHALVDLDPRVFAGFSPVKAPRMPPLTLADLRVQALEYLPDSQESEQVVEDPAHGQPAVEVGLTNPEAPGSDQHAWILAGATAMLGVPATFAVAPTIEAAEGMLVDQPVDESASKGTVRIQVEDKAFAFPIEQCQESAVPVDDTRYSVKVVRYLPHATVGPNRTIISASSQPVNPYIEVELTGPNGTELRRAFAKFPEFSAMHGATSNPAVEVTFQAAASTAPTTPIELIVGPDGKLHVRFSSEVGKILAAHETPIGTAVPTPWKPWELTVLRYVPKGRWERNVFPVEPVRKTGREQAVLLRFITAGQTHDAWVQYGHMQAVRVGEASYEVDFGEKQVALGFQLVLNEFKVGYYPGSQQPLSYESKITINDPHAGRELSRVISMNQPTEYGGYTFYQSSFDKSGEKPVSVLSVARDPGQPVVFTGYFMMMIGMIWVLVVRMSDRRGAARSAASPRPA